jgi:TRAP-type C4-dicarboxylate transport system permease small subunit
MSLLQANVPRVQAALPKAQQKELGHRIRFFLASVVAFVFLAAIGIYGASYYILPLEQRPYSDKHELLKPSGTIGLRLGILGTVLFFIIFLYALRKVIPWLGRWGTARHWMDFHVVAGVSAPIVIAYHASFKFQGIAGIAFWIMLAVALSGVIGRYLYSQIPRSLSAAELSLSELQNNEQELAEALLGQSVYSIERLNRTLRVPTKEHIRSIGPLGAVGEMIVLDLGMPLRIAGLRRSASDFGGILRSIGGLFSTGNEEVEGIVRLVRQKASLSKRIVFLDQTQKVFHLWHVIHRPFSYAFAVLALIHIAVVLGLGFGSMGMH